jgi:hypothetical protein
VWFLGTVTFICPLSVSQKTPRQTFWQAHPTLPELIDTIYGNIDAIKCIAANFADWVAYESRKWRAFQAWKARHHDTLEYADFCQQVADMRHDYLSQARPHIGWALIAAINE